MFNLRERVFKNNITRSSNKNNIRHLKVYSNELFLFQLTNDLCGSFTKLVIIFF